MTEFADKNPFVAVSIIWTVCIVLCKLMDTIGGIVK